MNIKIKLINRLFLISLLPVFGACWYFLDIDSPLITYLINIPLINLVIFPVITLMGFVAFTHPYLMPIILIPIFPAIVLGMLFIKKSDKETLLKTFLRLLIFILIFFTPIILRNIYISYQNQITLKSLEQKMNKQSSLLTQGIHVDYLGKMKSNTLYYDNGQQISLYNFKISADPKIFKQMDEGEYQMCLKSPNNNINTCLITSSLRVVKKSPYIEFINDFETDISLLKSKREISRIEDSQLFFILPGIDATEYNDIAYVDFIYKNNGIYLNKTVYSLALEAPLILKY